jgi:predicted membrane-bound spermidine synthase
MSARLLVFLVFVEGFASLGIEVIALRRLVPHVGSAITVTAPTIALFLLALTIGYWTGGRIKSGFGARVQANFLIAAGLAGVGLSTLFVQGLFAVIPSSGLAFVLFVAVVVCPPACLLAQTVPLMANLIEHERVGAASAVALTASTAGSVLGAVVISLGVMQLAGVSAAVALCCAALCLAAGVHALASRQSTRAATAALASAVLVGWNAGGPSLNTLESAYADYRVATRSARALAPDYSDPARVFLVNNQQASLLDASEPPKRSPYIERMQRLLLDELGFSGKQVLVLGAGGFTLSVGDTSNRYTYVDIDPHIRSVAERQFIRGPINGRFVAEDARRFVARTQERFDAVVVDVYTSSNAIPGHLLTAEFWRAARRVLSADGVVMANLVLDPALRSAFARNVLATIEQELGRCAVEVLQRHWAVSNVVVTCLPCQQEFQRATPYTDERSSADLDRAMGLR